MPTSRPASAGHYLIIQLARFGDLLQTKRLIATLLARPQSTVHLVVDRSLVDIAQLVYPQCVVHGVMAHRSGAPAPAEVLAANLGVFSSLREIPFAEVYNLNLSGMNFALSALFAPERVRGHKLQGGQEISDLWPRMAMRWTRVRRAAGLNLVDFWAELADDPIAPGEVNPIARRGGKGVGVVLAGRESRRSVPPAMLTTIAGAVAQGTRSERIVLMGSRGERSLAKEFMGAASSRLAAMTENTVGQTDWAGLIDTLIGLDAVITPDTGTMHLAAHLGVPVHALFLSSAWCFETGPYGIGHRVWQTNESCAPCLESDPCPYDVACLSAFADRELLRHLAGNPAFEIPQGLVGYVSAVDPLGVTYRPVLGEDPAAEKRQAFRALVGQHLGRNILGPAPDQSLVHRIFHEADWMLEQGASRYEPLESTPAPGADPSAAGT